MEVWKIGWKKFLVKRGDTIFKVKASRRQLEQIFSQYDFPVAWKGKISLPRGKENGPPSD